MSLIRYTVAILSRIHTVLSHFCIISVFLRAGILFVNPADLGWNPPVASWIDSREVQSERANLTILFDKYIPPILEALKTRLVTLEQNALILLATSTYGDGLCK